MFINYWFDDLDFCLDTGVCKEGLPFNTEKGKIIVNKDTCLDHNGKWDTVSAAEFVSDYGLNWVPIVSTNYKLPDTVDEMLAEATGPSVVNPGVLREGWVLRTYTENGVISFKAVSPEFLIKNKE